MSRSVVDSGIVEHKPAFLARWILRPATVVLDGTWHVLKYILGAVIVGGILVNVLISFITTGTPGVADPRTWVTIRALIAQPLYSAIGLGILIILILGAFLVHRVAHPAGPDARHLTDLKEIYGLAPVVSAEPSNQLIPSFNPSIYIPRRTADTHVNADELARTELHSAMSRRDPTSHDTNYGFCVYGRKLLGTSRLAWEAMKYEVKHNRDFSKWTLVRWPSEPRRHIDLLRALVDRHAQVVVWLEDLAELASTERHMVISSLPGDLTESEIPFVIIATCEDGYGAKAAQQTFGELVQHLSPIRLADITRDEASQLVLELDRAGNRGHHDEQYDGRPGSIVLGVTSMHNEVYPRLPLRAKQALRAIKLLRSAGIRDYPIKRVIATATDACGATGSSAEWDQAFDALKNAGFLSVHTVAATLVMTNEVYLDLAVPDFAHSQPPATDEWPALQASLTRAQDWKALARLGDAFRRRGDYQQAETCYRAALGGLTKDTAADAWALAQFGLGSILLGQIEASSEAERGPLLDQAKAAFSAALTVVTPDSDSTIWAEASGGLATVYRTEAATGLDALLRQGVPTTRQRRIRGQALESALAESRDALKILKRETAPAEWAEAQYQQGMVYYTTALLSGDPRDRRSKLDAALEAHRRALTTFTESENPVKVARVERAMGDTCKLRAEASIRPRKDEMLQQAISAYTHAIGISDARHLWSDDERAGMRASLATCLRSLAMLSTMPRQGELLQRAVEEWRAAIPAFDPTTSVILRAEALRDVGGALAELALQAEPDKKPDLWTEGLAVYADAFKLLGGRGTKALRAQLHLGIASIHGQRMANATPPTPLDVVQAYGNAQHALQLFPQTGRGAELTQARRIVREAEHAARLYKVPLIASGDTSLPRKQREAS